MSEHHESCPFCRGVDIAYGADVKKSAGGPALYITWRECLGCFARGPAFESADGLPKNKEDTEVWNTRTPDPRVEKLVEALREIVICDVDAVDDPEGANQKLTDIDFLLSDWEGGK